MFVGGSHENWLEVLIKHKNDKLGHNKVFMSLSLRKNLKNKMILHYGEVLDINTTHTRTSRPKLTPITLNKVTPVSIPTKTHFNPLCK